ncbi:MAG: pyridoxamine 5'-phosphate oxidase family protein [Actinomycetota bacterium]|nr:pyridoxamine 5'-phosphate oxidase family protein [Actinomycetota bacterium]
MSRRDQIRMTDEEVADFLEQERTVICATIGRDGFPHLMPLWYVVRDGQIWAWTFAKSQKARNLERDPRATLEVEAGKEYAQLRGVMLRSDVTIHRDTEIVTAFGMELFDRYQEDRPDPPGELPDDVREMVHAQAPKRVALQFAERSRVTWDHRKLAAGVY